MTMYLGQQFSPKIFTRDDESLESKVTRNITDKTVESPAISPASLYGFALGEFVMVTGGRRKRGVNLLQTFLVIVGNWCFNFPMAVLFILNVVDRYCKYMFL